MASIFYPAENSQELQAVIDKRDSDIFAPRLNEPQLQVSRVYKDGEEMARKKPSEVASPAQLKSLQMNSKNLLQVFIIRQKRSWAPLDISRELFEHFVEVYAVFPSIWKCIFAFGNKCEEHECEFPGIQSRVTSMPSKEAIGPDKATRLIFARADEVTEVAYVIRRAELNHRKPSDGQIPWSIRQTAVYYQCGPQSTAPSELKCTAPSASNLRSTLLLISPSQSTDRKINGLLESAVSNEGAVSPCVLHSVIVADSMSGWMDYTAWLEQEIKQRSDKVTFATLGTGNGNVIGGFRFDVEDRQALKLAEDSVTDLQIVLSTLHNTVQGIRKYCQKCCALYCVQRKESTRACSIAIEEFDGHITEIELCIKRASMLKDRVISTAQLLSDLLRYEDQKALKDLTELSQVENRTMMGLAEKSGKDAEAVKVLTIIGLVYLPTTFVANFFSTEFVKTDDNDRMSLSTNTWLLAAIALPLTMLTVALWWLCVRYKTSSAPHKPPEGCTGSFGHGWVSWLRQKRKPRIGDIENPTFSSTGPGPISTKTWSTGKITLQDVIQ